MINLNSVNLQAIGSPFVKIGEPANLHIPVLYLGESAFKDFKIPLIDGFEYSLGKLIDVDGKAVNESTLPFEKSKAYQRLERRVNEFVFEWQVNCARSQKEYIDRGFEVMHWRHNDFLKTLERKADTFLYYMRNIVVASRPPVGEIKKNNTYRNLLIASIIINIVAIALLYIKFNK